MPFVCGGSISTVSSGASHIDADRRRAILTPTAPGQASVVEIEWDVLSPECDGLAYDGLPPFFVEGNAADVDLIEAILRRPEGQT